MRSKVEIILFITVIGEKWRSTFTAFRWPAVVTSLYGFTAYVSLLAGSYQPPYKKDTRIKGMKHCTNFTQRWLSSYSCYTKLWECVQLDQIIPDWVYCISDRWQPFSYHALELSEPYCVDYDIFRRDQMKAHKHQIILRPFTHWFVFLHLWQLAFNSIELQVSP